MSSIRKRQALYGRAPSAKEGETLSCPDPITGRVTTVPAGATYNINVSNSGASAYTLSGSDRNGSAAADLTGVVVETTFKF